MRLVLLLAAWLVLMVLWAKTDSESFECATRYVTCVKVIK
jgi:hypothetical protein